HAHRPAPILQDREDRVRGRGAVRAMRSAMRPIVIEGCATLQTWRCGAASGRRECAARKRGVNWTVSGGLVASGRGEVRLGCGQNRAENPDDAANCAGLASEI